MVNPAFLNVKADDKFIDDDDNLPVFTSTITGFRNGEANTITCNPFYTVSPTYRKEHPGIYMITPYGLKLRYQNNYTITYLPGSLYVNDDDGRNVVPRLDCVELLSNDPSGFKYAAHFSYQNPNSTVVYVPLGTNNKITSSGHYSGQLPIVFMPGSGQFKIYFDGTKITWTLATNNSHYCTPVTAVASSTSTKCSGGSGTYQAGAVESTATTETMESAPEASASIYPNPTRDLVNIEAQEHQASITSTAVEIIDAFGRISSASGRKLSDHNLQIDLNGRNSGV